MVIMQSWPVGNSRICAAEPLGCMARTGRQVVMPSGVAPTQWMCVRGMAFTAAWWPLGPSSGNS